MAAAWAQLTKLIIVGTLFPLAINPPGSTRTFFLGGAGEREVEIGEKSITFSAIGVYLDDSAVSSLATNWKGKSAEELGNSTVFYRDIYKGHFEKIARVTFIKPLNGRQYSEKVAENCVSYWIKSGRYTKARVAALKKFKEAFKPQIFPPNSSVFFTLSPFGNLTIGFSRDANMPTYSNAVIRNRALTEALLETMIGENGVSPAAKQSLAQRFSQMLNGSNEQQA